MATAAFKALMATVFAVLAEGPKDEVPRPSSLCAMVAAVPTDRAWDKQVLNFASSPSQVER